MARNIRTNHSSKKKGAMILSCFAKGAKTLHFPRKKPYYYPSQSTTTLIYFLCLFLSMSDK